MQSTRLQLSGVSARRLILVPEERQGEDRPGRPRIRRYRLGVLSGDALVGAPVGARAKVAPGALSRALRA